METERILLRHWQESDAEALFKYASDPDVGPRAGWPAHKSVEESREIIRTFFHNDTTWAIVLKETGEAIGCIGYYTHETSNIPIGENDCEVGYWVGKPYWNKGICTEALKLIRPLRPVAQDEKKVDVPVGHHRCQHPAGRWNQQNLLMTVYALISKIGIDEPKALGLDTSMVVVERVPLLQKMHRSDRFSGNIFFYFLFSSVDIFFSAEIFFPHNLLLPN